MNDEIQRIKELIFKSKLKLAIGSIRKLLDNYKSNLINGDYASFEEELVVLAQDFERLSKDKRIRTEDSSFINTEINRIALSILQLLTAIEQSLHQNVISFSDIKGGLKLIDSNRGMEMACKAIRKAQSMRVIGSGRQDLVEDSLNPYILDYYKEIESRLADSGDGKFVIKRITQHLLKDTFRTHLERCYKILGNSSKNKFDIVLYGNLRLAYTYAIIDSHEKNQSILFLTLHTKNNDIDVIDTSMVFYSQDISIIQKFKTHFDQFWEKEGVKGRVIKSQDDFEKYIPFDNQLFKSYSEVKNFIKRVPNNSIRMDHLKYEIDLFHRRLKGLDDCELRISHTHKNQRMSHCFFWYMSELQQGMSYKTISLDRFWYCLYDIERFIEKQEVALLQGAKIERIFQVNSNKLEDKEYFEAQQRIIYKNLIQHQKFDNYTFSILFSEDDKELYRRRNFAIWSDDNKDYQVVFLLRYGQKDAQTVLYFINRPKNKKLSSIPHDNEEKLNTATNQFNRGKQVIIAQNKRLLKYLSQGTKVHEFEQKITFLKKCGVPNVADYLKSC
ncbi:MAG: hypothetical protein ACPGJS_19115 [Flammeovirgaceae bacterium]